MSILKNKIYQKSINYPARLRHLSSPPKELSCAGADIEELCENPTLGIVGARKFTSYGSHVTGELASAAARAGAVIVSGLALGIDSIAHKACLESGGKTIAVLPSGLDEIYPSTHRQLAHRILQGNGALISEYTDGFRPRRESFIQRNRLIAALSDALLVTEAALQSGSLHTARFALELGKPVLAVPGNINSYASTGTNNLIKAGAQVVTGSDDLLEILTLDQTPEQLAYGENPAEQTLIDLLSSGLTSGDELHSKSNLTVQQFQQNLTMLEIKGVIKPLGNNHWSLRKSK